MVSFDVSSFNWIAIVMAGVSAWIIGAIWFSPPVFGRRWMAALGLKQEQLGNPAPGFVAALVISIIGATFLRWVIGVAGATSGAGHAATCDRLTTLARRRSRLRPSDRLHLVRGRPRPRRVSRPDRGDDGGRLPHAGGPAGPKARGGPTPLRIRLVGTPPGVVRTPRQPRAAHRPRPPGHQLGAERGGLAHVGLLRRRVPGGRVGAVPCDRRAPPPPGQRAGPGGLQLVPVLPRRRELQQRGGAAGAAPPETVQRDRPGDDGHLQEREGERQAAGNLARRSPVPARGRDAGSPVRVGGAPPHARRYRLRRRREEARRNQPTRDGGLQSMEGEAPRSSGPRGAFWVGVGVRRRVGRLKPLRYGGHPDGKR